MKINLPVTGTEKDYPSYTSIVSTTDLKGRITHVNQDFIDISGFQEDELLGKSHNIVRHPEMPPEAFQDLWSTLKRGQSWLGLVNNRCKNGDHYWVEAFVAPIIENGETIGYQSVRAKPQHQHVDRANKLYQKIKAGKLAKGAFSSIGFSNKLMLAILAALSPMAVAGLAVGQGMANWILAAGLVTSAVLAVVFAKLLAAPLVKAAKDAEAIYNNPIARKVFTGRSDEIGQLQLALKMQAARLRTLVGRAQDAGQGLSDTALSLAANVETTNNNLNQQKQGIDQVSSSINELNATANEIVQTTVEAANIARSGHQASDHINTVISSTIGVITKMESELQNAADVVRSLEKDSNTIGTILDVIRSIAEQTNLLALNAAIEAARAGEAGRGFAVVADEVRTLASRTAESTEEIQAMIEQLQNHANNAVNTVNAAEKQAEEGSEKITESAESMHELTEAINRLNDMNTQFAAMAQEQNTIVQDINTTMTDISQAAENTTDSASLTAASSERLTKMAANLNSVVHQCDV